MNPLCIAATGFSIAVLLIGLFYLMHAVFHRPPELDKDGLPPLDWWDT